MEKVDIGTPLKCLQEEIRIFKKNEEAAYDILALYQLLLENIHVHSLVGITLTEKVIHDLEDPEVTFPLKADTFPAFLRYFDDYFYTILRKYKDIEECKQCWGSFNTSYKNIISKKDISSLFYRSQMIEFNFIKDLLNRSPQFLYKFLVSEIPFTTRLNMFAYALGSYKQDGLRNFLGGVDKTYLSEEEYNKICIKIPEILKAFNENQCKFLEVEDLIESLLLNKQFGYIKQLKDFGINFNQCRWEWNLRATSKSDRKILSIVGILMDYKQSLSYIKDFYEDASYLEIDKEIRNNDDFILLSTLGIEDIHSFIKFSNFELTEEKVRFLATSQMKTIEDYSISELNLIKDDFRKQNQRIADTIIHKAKNKEEYKKLQKQANLFIKLTDIDKLIAKRKEEQEREVQDQLLLEKKRQEFSTLLYNMNEYAQENIPPRILIKNIKFGE